ncbi:MAG: hypothetical protein IKQ40_06885 [Lachnospiraceae bacterium]|nr:hypothetical protein [Lachnospiraceae bacterium]
MMSGFAQSIAIAHEEIGEERGEARGITLGEGRFAKLVSTLISMGRTEDVKRAADDEEARKQLYREFNLID